MSRPIRLLFSGAALALSAAVAGTAFGQAAPAPKSHSEVRIFRDGSDMTIEQDGKTVFARHGRHRDMAQHLRDILQLRPNQEAALAAYVQALEAKPAMTLPAGDTAPKTTPERLAMMEKMIADHEAAMHARIEATRRFYDQLDPAQKKAFDELHEGPGFGLFHLASLGPMEDMAFMTMPPMPPLPPMPAMPPEPPAPPSPQM
jgi:hypothetical protein